MSGCAWVTLATNDTYCLGALVLAHSLKKVSTRHQLAIIITPQVSPSMREQLSKVFDVVQLVDVLDSQDAANLALLQRPDLGVTFTKIHCWNLTQYSRCVFLDADTLVIQNCDELMEREELSAAPDPGWPDCFNSGVFVFAPSQETFKQLIQFASTHGSFDGGDQGLLNMYFNDWPTSDIRKHLSFLYNMCSTSTYTYLPALKYYGANIKIVHFIGANKPWLLGPSGAGMSSFSQAWWDMFQSYVVQHLSKDMREYCPSWSDTTVASSFQSDNTSNTNDKSSLIQKTNPPRYKFTDPWENVSGKTKNKPQNLPPDKNIQKTALANHVKYNVIAELPKISYYPLKSNLGNDSLPTDNLTTTTSYNYLKNNTFQHFKKNEDFNNKENIVNVPQPNRHQNYVYRLSDSKKDETVNEKFKCVIQTPAEIASLFKTTGRLNDFNPTNPENVKNATVCGFNTNDARNSNSAGCLGSQYNSGLAGALGSKERSAIEEQWRKQNWEQGNIDFTGKDSFENIWQKIMDAVNKPKVESPKPVQALVPKEIASQAISEKEKADIPASEAAKEEEKAAEPQEARTPVPEEVKKDIAPLPVASVPAELPKEDQKPLTPEVPKKDQPIPIPPPTPEKADVPKLPESSKPLETLGSSAPDSKEALPSTAEPPKPVELSKTPETLPPVQAAEEPVVQMQAAVAQQPAKVDEPKLDLAGDLPKIEDILKGLEQTLLAEQIKGEQKESNIMPLDQPKIEDILKGLEQTLLAELPKDSKISPLEIPKMPTDISQAPEEQKKVEESQAPPPPVPAQASAPGTPQAPLPEVLKTDAPLPEIPKPETPSSKAPKAEEPKPQAPEAPAKQQSEAPMTPAPLPEAPITPASQGAPMTPAPLPEVPTTPASQPEAPMAPAPLPEVPTTPASQPEAPTTPASQPETPMTPTPLPEALKTPVPKPEVPKTEAPPQAETGASEVPKPIEAPKQSTPEAQKVEAVQPVPVETPLPAPDVPTPLAQTKPETVSAVPAPSETKEVTTESKTDEGKKQKEGQKPAKQQAPQPPPKNGKQKKGQQPEPTSAHPLADAPVQPEAGKEEQKAAPQVPLTPPTSPDSQVKEPEALVKASEPQPGTPIITAPTPPVTPSDAFKVEDPLSAQIKSDETVPATGSSGGADAPVPPKRKGKANEKQPPKPQNNGGKGKGKK